jgi:Mycothiol maleylpyruvate isomerase N-terminal domain
MTKIPMDGGEVIDGTGSAVVGHRENLSDRPPAISAFVEAAAYAGELISSDTVGGRWRAPSALELMTVGAVVGHLFLVVRRVGQRIEGIPLGLPDAAQRQSPPSLAGDWTWLRIDETEDLDQPDHRQVRLDAERVADWGWEAVRDAYQARIEKVSLLLRDECPAEVQVSGRALPFPAYLATRVVELVVHADDLACSVDLEARPPLAAIEIAIQTMVDAARLVHGDVAVLRALTRRERTADTISAF